MGHHVHLFWWVLAAVAVLGLVIAVRLVAKRQERSQAEQAAADAGLGRADHTTPAPPHPDSHR
jgi:HAMP domain-containing protein